jgi:eukaryotic-like serine/threonine-protein kinase
LSRATPPILVPDTSAETFAPETVALSARRLGIASAIAAVVHVIYVVLYRTVWVDVGNPVGLLAALLGLLASVAAAAYLLTGTRPVSRVVAVGVSYESLLALSMSVSESWATVYRDPTEQVSWSAVVIVLFPFLIPARPAVVLAASILAASMTPLGMALVFGLTDKNWPPVGVLVSYLLPPFACAMLAWAPTRALSQMIDVVQKARRLGNYELTERLGAGGMGEVWLAKHRLLARPAAVKLIKPEMLGAKDPESRERVLRRFEREAQVTANLDSPHTVELYDFGVSPDGVLFYVMELLHGVDLETLVTRFGPLPSERVVHFLLQACDSLEDAHRRGLIHRDIKPANLFVSRKGSSVDFLKVLDFGLVKRSGAPPEAAPDSLGDSVLNTKQTAANQFIGTPAFMPPEAILGDQAVDHRADIYALGCVAYWLLTATLVFAEATTVATLTAHVMKQPDPPSERVATPIAPELERVVLDCLQKDRDRRPASAEALRAALSSIPLAEPWSRERATAWWAAHMPARSEPPVPGSRTTAAY